MISPQSRKGLREIKFIRIPPLLTLFLVSPSGGAGGGMKDLDSKHNPGPLIRGHQIPPLKIRGDGGVMKSKNREGEKTGLNIHTGYGNYFA